MTNTNESDSRSPFTLVQCRQGPSATRLSPALDLAGL